jgi:hypothetical protein
VKLEAKCNFARFGICLGFFLQEMRKSEAVARRVISHLYKCTGMLFKLSSL